MSAHDFLRSYEESIRILADPAYEQMVRWYAANFKVEIEVLEGNPGSIRVADAVVRDDLRWYKMSVRLENRMRMADEAQRAVRDMCSKRDMAVLEGQKALNCGRYQVFDDDVNMRWINMHKIMLYHVSREEREG